LLDEGKEGSDIVPVVGEEVEKGEDTASSYCSRPEKRDSTKDSTDALY
jgi:hypothetical protein